MEKVEC